jgi:hypothetical protein
MVALKRQRIKLTKLADKGNWADHYKEGDRMHWILALIHCTVIPYVIGPVHLVIPPSKVMHQN